MCERQGEREGGESVCVREREKRKKESRGVCGYAGPEE